MKILNDMAVVSVKATITSVGLAIPKTGRIVLVCPNRMVEKSLLAVSRSVLSKFGFDRQLNQATICRDFGGK